MLKRSCVFAVLATAALGLFNATPAQAQSPSFIALLQGVNEVPPVDTDAVGICICAPIDLLGEQGLAFVLFTNGLADITGASIHLGGEGDVGDAVASIYDTSMATSNIVFTNGNISIGVLFAEDLIGDLAGFEIADLVTQIANGNAYVNVFSTAQEDGEIRGQLGLLPTPGAKAKAKAKPSRARGR